MLHHVSCVLTHLIRASVCVCVCNTQTTFKSRLLFETDREIMQTANLCGRQARQHLTATIQTLGVTQAAAKHAAPHKKAHGPNNHQLALVHLHHCTIMAVTSAWPWLADPHSRHDNNVLRSTQTVVAKKCCQKTRSCHTAGMWRCAATIKVAQAHLHIMCTGQQTRDTSRSAKGPRPCGGDHQEVWSVTRHRNDHILQGRPTVFPTTGHP